MNTFKTKSYQLKESKKWMSAGEIYEHRSGATKITQMSFPEKQFNTSDEADRYFISFYEEKGYKRIK